MAAGRGGRRVSGVGRGEVHTAVIPAAGLGTRFLPATKAVPKEMLPVVDRPMIQYALEEAVRAGIRRVVVVTADGKEAIERHLAPDRWLEAALEAAGKHDLLADVRGTCPVEEVVYVRQEEPLGLGHAVAVTRDAVGADPFAVLLPDEIVTGPLLERMVEVMRRESASVIGLLEVPPSEISAYGVPEVEPVDEALVRVRSIVEKPPAEEAPSGYATIGRYVFTPEVFDALDALEPGVGGEVQLTDAVDVLAAKQGVFGVVADGGRHDVGRKLDFLRAGVELALLRDDLGPGMRAFLADVVRRHGIP